MPAERAGEASTKTFHSRRTRTRAWAGESLSNLFCQANKRFRRVIKRHDQDDWWRGGEILKNTSSGIMLVEGHIPMNARRNLIKSIDERRSSSFAFSSSLFASSENKLKPIMFTSFTSRARRSDNRILRREGKESWLQSDFLSFLAGTFYCFKLSLATDSHLAIKSASLLCSLCIKAKPWEALLI